MMTPPLHLSSPTVQSIVVMHTLLKNGFRPGERIVRKAIVVTPTRCAHLTHRMVTRSDSEALRTGPFSMSASDSLVKNWHKEIEKWVGDDPDIGVVAITGGFPRLVSAV